MSSDRIAEALSWERLGPYLTATANDLGAALRLYDWNVSVSGALYEDLGVLEVALRNAIHDRLTTLHADEDVPWYEDPRGLLSPEALQDIDRARERVTRQDRPETPGRVVAELNFGFWRYLFAGRYEATLWTPALRHAFPNLRPQRRAAIADTTGRLHRLRNRIAHHEPIHRRNLARDATAIDTLLGWIDSEVLQWARSRSRLAAVLESRPH